MTVRSISQIIDDVIAAEGGYVNDPADAGGETMYGITAAVARANGYSGPMSALPRSLAVQIYSTRYVFEPKFDRVGEVAGGIGRVLGVGRNTRDGDQIPPQHSRIGERRRLVGVDDDRRRDEDAHAARITLI